MGDINGKKIRMNYITVKHLVRIYDVLFFDFDIGDLIRWLGAVYTHAYITLDPIKAAILALCYR